MSQTPFIKSILRSLGRNLFYVFRWIISRIPYEVFKVLTPVFIAFGRPLVHNKKRLIMENLRSALGQEKSDQEIRKIAEDYFDNMGRGMIELIYFIDRPQKIIKKVAFEGKEHLDQALAKGQGAILLSAHFGNFVLMLLYTALIGYKANIIVRRLKDLEFDKYITDYRKDHGIKTIYTIPYRECIVQSLKCLKNNEILFILLDQNYGDEGRVFVDFFGKPAATATGPIVFSQRSGAPILPAFIIRDGKDHFKMTIDPPVELIAPEGDTDETTQNIAQLTKIIEDIIRRYPHEWGGWMHRRWKSQA